LTAIAITVAPVVEITISVYTHHTGCFTVSIDVRVVHR